MTPEEYVEKLKEFNLRRYEYLYDLPLSSDVEAALEDAVRMVGCAWLYDGNNWHLEERLWAWFEAVD